jgi:hypothetical protein
MEDVNAEACLYEKKCKMPVFYHKTTLPIIKQIDINKKKARFQHNAEPGFGGG